jgi:DNA primase
VAIVVEGEIDLISSYQAGIKNIVAIKGSALTEEQVRLLGRFAPKFILALDSDMAGDAAARRGIKVAGEIGVEVKVARITGYKDPDDAARGNLESYKNDLIHAEGIYDYFIDSVFSRNKGESGAVKAKISKEIIPILGEISDKIVQAHYANIVARKLEVPLEAVLEQITKTVGSISINQTDKTIVESSDEPTRRDLLEERLLALAFQSDPKILDPKNVSDLITAPLNLKILEEYKKYSHAKTFNLSDFGKSLPAELFAGFTKIVLIDNQNLMDNPEELKKELDLIEKELKIQTVREKLKNLAREMRETEAGGESAKLLTAQNEFDKLAKSLSDYEEE